MVKTISIDFFNQKGMPEKIFEEVKNGDPVMVVDGDEKLCVLLSPRCYVAMVRESEGL